MTVDSRDSPSTAGRGGVTSGPEQSAVAWALSGADRVLLCGDRRHWRTADLARTLTALEAEYWLLEPFCPRQALELIDARAITVSDWYPWQLQQVLELPADVRAAYLGASHRAAWIGGGRIGASLREGALAWWGSIVSAHLGGMDWPGSCVATGAEVAEHSFLYGCWEGEAGSQLRVVDGDDNACSTGQIGRLQAVPTLEPAPALADALLGYAEDARFYGLGPESAALRTEYGWCSPWEGEALLETHPAVAEAALIKCTENGRRASEAAAESRFMAVVRLAEPTQPATRPTPHLATQQGTPLLEIELLDYCRRRLSAIKCPLGVIFSTDLPRAPGGDVDRAALATEFLVDD